MSSLLPSLPPAPEVAPKPDKENTPQNRGLGPQVPSLFAQTLEMHKPKIPVRMSHILR